MFVWGKNTKSRKNVSFETLLKVFGFVSSSFFLCIFWGAPFRRAVIYINSLSSSFGQNIKMKLLHNLHFPHFYLCLPNIAAPQKVFY